MMMYYIIHFANHVISTMGDKLTYYVEFLYNSKTNW